MKITIHKADERGISDLGWLKSRFSFSFADWYNPQKMGFGALRVLNDDYIKTYSGFPMHGHRDMEIITIVRKGEVTHQDNMGNTGRVVAGEVQVMSAGKGIIHSEYNLSKTDDLELFQIWIKPDRNGHESEYMQRRFNIVKKNQFELLVSGDNNDDALHIHQDAKIYRGTFSKGQNFIYSLTKPENGMYLFLIEGSLQVENEVIFKRDAVGITDTDAISFTTIEVSEILFFEVPMVE